MASPRLCEHVPCAFFATLLLAVACASSVRADCPPAVGSISGGTALTFGESATITANVSNGTGRVEQSDDGQTWSLYISSFTTQTAWSVSAGKCAGAKYFRLFVTDCTGTQPAGSTTVTWETLPASVVLTPSATTVPPSSTYSVTIEYTELRTICTAQGGCNNVPGVGKRAQLYHSDNGGVTWVSDGCIYSTTPTGTETRSFNTPNCASSRQHRVDYCDNCGGVQSTSIQTVTWETLPASVVLTPSAMTVPPSSTYSVTIEYTELRTICTAQGGCNNVPGVGKRAQLYHSDNGGVTWVSDGCIYSTTPTGTETRSFNTPSCASSRQHRVDYCDNCGVSRCTSPVVVESSSELLVGNCVAPDSVLLGQSFLLHVFPLGLTGTTTLETSSDGVVWSTVNPASPGVSFGQFLIRTAGASPGQAFYRLSRNGCKGPIKSVTWGQSLACLVDPNGLVARWYNRDPSCGGLGRPQTTSPGGANYVDCAKPFVLILHGGWSDHNAPWIPCLVESLGNDTQRFPDGVNVLVSDVKGLMRPGVPLGDDQVTRLVTEFFTSLLGARANLVPAGLSLADRLFCEIGCSNPQVPLIVGHSFGGVYASVLAERLKARGVDVGTIVTLDSPWWSAPELVSTASRSSEHIVNFYSNQLAPQGAGVVNLFGVGSTVNDPEFINIQANSTECGDFTAGCEPNAILGNTSVVVDHWCLPVATCDWLKSSVGRDATSGAIEPGSYGDGNCLTGPTPGPTPAPSIDLGAVNGTMTLQNWATPVDQPLSRWVNVSEATTTAEVLSLTCTGTQAAWGYAPLSLPTDAGPLLMEWSASGILPEQTLRITLNGEIIWSVHGPISSQSWTLAVLDASRVAGIAGVLTVEMTPPSAASAPPPLFSIRSLRVLPLAAVMVAGAPQMLMQPESVTQTVGRTALLGGVVSSGCDGLTFVWRRNGIPISNGGRILGADGPKLRISDLQPGDAGLYDYTASNLCGSVVANSFALRVVPVCPADFDFSGLTDTDDLFAFLDAWFTQYGQSGPGFSADLNMDESVDPDDLFEFLDLWFAENGNCP